ARRSRRRSSTSTRRRRRFPCPSVPCWRMHARTKILSTEFFAEGMRMPSVFLPCRPIHNGRLAGIRWSQGRDARMRRRFRRGRRGVRLLALIPLALAVLYALVLHAIRPLLLEHAQNYVVHEASFALYDVLTDTVYQNRAEYENLV